MPKKSFKGNPALQFISSSGNKEPVEEERTEAREPRKPKATGKGRPDPAKAPPSIIPQGYRLVPEAKSKRVQLLMQPSLFQEAKKAATAENLSLNEYIGLVLRRELGL